MATDNVIKLQPTRPCPVCKKPSTQASFPFCSPRCADIDLNRWLSGAYVIPGRAADAVSEAGAADDAPGAYDEDEE